MQAMREILTVEQGQVTLHLPHTLWGQQIEIIVLPVQQQDPRSFPKKDLRGCLRQYAKPELMATEQAAWLEAVREKYVPR